MKLSRTFGHQVRVTFKDGETMTGKVEDYTSALDNEPDPESITIRYCGALIECFAPEIEKVEVLD
ncbi:MAG: hypothetical protein ACI4AO_05365 [Anaerotignum sp.]